MTDVSLSLYHLPSLGWVWAKDTLPKVIGLDLNQTGVPQGEFTTIPAAQLSSGDLGESVNHWLSRRQVPRLLNSNLGAVYMGNLPGR